MLTRWWSEGSARTSDEAKRRVHHATGDVPEVLRRVWWELVAVACLVIEQEERFSKGRSEHYAYIRAILRMRKERTWKDGGGALRLFALRWSECAATVAVPIGAQARLILKQRDLEQRITSEKRHREHVARIGKRTLVRILTQSEVMLQSGWAKKVGVPVESIWDPEARVLVTDATPEELAAARIERRTERCPRP
jgi:hypothetical protein